LTVALQIAFALYGVSFAIGEALFAEGSFDESRLPSLLKRSGRLLVMVQVPALIVVAVAGPFVLRLFGEGYRQYGENLLVILAIAAIPVALHTWADFALRLLGLMKNLVISGVVCTGATVLFSQIWGDRGLEWFGWSILIGTSVSGLYGVVVITVHQRKRQREACELHQYEEAGVANG
jgi:O-antigen/teichoic acid export membrane protein